MQEKLLLLTFPQDFSAADCVADLKHWSCRRFAGDLLAQMPYVSTQQHKHSCFHQRMLFQQYPFLLQVCFKYTYSAFSKIACWIRSAKFCHGTDTLLLKDKLWKQIHNLYEHRNQKLWVQIDSMLVEPFQYIVKIHFLLQNKAILLGRDLVVVGLFMLNIILCHLMRTFFL